MWSTETILERKASNVQILVILVKIFTAEHSLVVLLQRAFNLRFVEEMIGMCISNYCGI